MSLIAPQDAAFLLGETPAQPTHVAGLAVYELPPNAGRDYVGGLYRELLSHTAVRSRLRQRPADPVGSIGNIWWTEEADVDLEYHVRLAALPRPGRMRELLALVSRLHGQPLDRHHPLWEFYVIEGLEGNRFATYSKIHHALYDGVSSTELLTNWLSPDPDSRVATPWWSTAHEESQAEENDGPSRDVARDIVRLAGQPVRVVRDLARVSSSVGRMVARCLRGRGAGVPYRVPRTMLNTSITGSRRFITHQWPLSRIKGAGALHGATVNDVVLAKIPVFARSLIDETKTVRGFWLFRWFTETPQDRLLAAINRTVQLVESGALRIPEGQPIKLEDFSEAVHLAEAPEHGGKPLLVFET